MYCYYQGELEVTKNTEECLLEDVITVEVDIFEDCNVFTYKINGESEKIIVNFSNSFYITEDKIRNFVEEIKKIGWKVNAKIPYYGDYEGWMLITDNEIEEFSTDEMAVKDYLESDEIKKTKTLIENAVSANVYLFLREIFGKEEYTETVILFDLSEKETRKVVELLENIKEDDDE